MAGLDPTIPLGIKQPDVAGQIGAWQQLGIQADQARSARNAADLSTATLPLSIRQAGAAASTAEIGTKQAQTQLSREQYQPLLTSIGSLATDPAIVNYTKLSAMPDFKTQMADPNSEASKAWLGTYRAITNARRTAVAQGTPDDVARDSVAQLLFQAAQDPASLVPEMIQSLKIAQGPGASSQQMFPAPQVLNTGQVAQPIAAGNPALTGVPAGAPQGMPTQMQLPPTQPVMRNGVPGVLGANPAPGPVQTGPALGQPEAVQGRVVPNVKHFADVQAAAIAAPQRITQLQEIKTLAPQAMTGDANTLRTILSKLAGYVGIEISVASQTKTDELAKATAQLMDRAGATDAAREVAAMATPNYKMTKEAINNVSSSLIGLERRNLAASKFFTGVPQDGPEYDKRLQTWNNIPQRDKAFMFMALPVDEKTAAAQKMRGTPQAKEIAAGIRAIEALGLK
jgi:hypothetical protein